MLLQVLEVQLQATQFNAPTEIGWTRPKRPILLVRNSLKHLFKRLDILQYQRCVQKYLTKKL